MFWKKKELLFPHSALNKKITKRIHNIPLPLAVRRKIFSHIIKDGSQDLNFRSASVTLKNWRRRLMHKSVDGVFAVGRNKWKFWNQCFKKNLILSERGSYNERKFTWRLPLGQYSLTRQQCGGSMQAPMKRTIWSCWRSFIWNQKQE